ncbi:MAG: hypothetical protein LUO91_00225, partial [Methanomicrobiales archaeon]|nr:hypothetical protein [Methanomicrobiales archaeon]
MKYPALLLIFLIFLMLCLTAGCTDVLGSAGGILDAVSPGLPPGVDSPPRGIPLTMPEPALTETMRPATTGTAVFPQVTTTVQESVPATHIPTSTIIPTTIPTPATTVTTPATTV